MDQIFSVIADVFSSNEMFNMAIMIIGSLTTVISIIDASIPDNIDGGFYKKIDNIPVLGALLRVAARFSVLRGKKDV